MLGGLCCFTKEGWRGSKASEAKAAKKVLKIQLSLWPEGIPADAALCAPDVGLLQLKPLLKTGLCQIKESSQMISLHFHATLLLIFLMKMLIFYSDTTERKGQILSPHWYRYNPFTIRKEEEMRTSGWLWKRRYTWDSAVVQGLEQQFVSRGSQHWSVFI